MNDEKLDATHKITFESGDSLEVILRPNGRVIYADGLTDTGFRVNEQGLWSHENYGWNEITVENLNKSPKIKKGQEVKEMPVGTVITLVRSDDGWRATCRMDGVAVQLRNSGAVGALSKVCRDWFRERYPRNKEP